MTKLLTSEQISDLCQAHCYRVIDNMDMDDLMSYAIQMMYQSFDKTPGQGDTDVDMLIEDIWVAEGEDDDSTEEFIAGVVGSELAKEIVENTQFWNWHTGSCVLIRYLPYYKSQPNTPKTMNEEHDSFYDWDDEETRSEVEEYYGYGYDDLAEGLPLSCGFDF